MRNPSLPIAPLPGIPGSGLIHWTCVLSLLIGAPSLAHDLRKAGGESQADALFAPVDQHEPGVAVLVARDGQVLLRKGYGMADVEAGKPVTPDTPFYLASVSKQFTAMAVLMLAHAGKLSLDTPVSERISEFKRYRYPVTARQLMHHVAGLPDYIEPLYDATPAPDQVYPAILRTITQGEPEFAPGSKFEYSNSAYVVLGLLVGKAAQMPYGGFLQQQIFTPLGMAHTSVIADAGQTMQEMAVPYRRKGEAYQATGFGADALDRVYGDGGVLSSVEDLYRWDQALYGEKLVGPSTLSEAFTPGKLDDGSSTGYGAGWTLRTFEGKRQIGHTGYWDGCHALIWRFPDQHFTVILLSNRDDFEDEDLAESLTHLYLQD